LHSAAYTRKKESYKRALCRCTNTIKETYEDMYKRDQYHTVDAVKTSSLPHIYVNRDLRKSPLYVGKRPLKGTHISVNALKTVTAYIHQKRPVKEPYIGGKNTIKKTYITVHTVNTIKKTYITVHRTPLAQHQMYACKETYIRALDN